MNFHVLARRLRSRVAIYSHTSKYNQRMDKLKGGSELCFVLTSTIWHEQACSLARQPKEFNWAFGLVSEWAKNLKHTKLTLVSECSIEFSLNFSISLVGWFVVRDDMLLLDQTTWSECSCCDVIGYAFTKCHCHVSRMHISQSHMHFSKRVKCSRGKKFPCYTLYSLLFHWPPWERRESTSLTTVECVCVCTMCTISNTLYCSCPT